jgi:hypothetical protein
LLQATSEWLAGVVDPDAAALTAIFPTKLWWRYSLGYALAADAIERGLADACARQALSEDRDALAREVGESLATSLAEHIEALGGGPVDMTDEGLAALCDAWAAPRSLHEALARLVRPLTVELSGDSVTGHSR